MNTSNPINPNHETRQSGRSAAKHGRNTKYWKQTYVKRRKASLNRKGNRKSKGSVQRISELPESMQIEHCLTMARSIFGEIESERTEAKEVKPLHSDLPLDNSGRFEKPDARAELRALIEYALSTLPSVRRVHSPAVVDGYLTTVVKTVPARKPETVEDFLEAFPSMREAFVRLAMKQS